MSEISIQCMVGRQYVYISLWWATMLPTLRTTALDNLQAKPISSVVLNLFCPADPNIYKMVSRDPKTIQIERI